MAQIDTASISAAVEHWLSGVDRTQLVELLDIDSGALATPTGEREIDARVFEAVLRIMGERSFQSDQEAIAVLMFVRREWNRLSPSQRDALLMTIEMVYPSYSEPASCIVLMELLGECYANSRAMDVLERITNVEQALARSLVPVGLGAMLRSSDDPELARRARTALMALTHDSDSDVRDEAEYALRTLSDLSDNCDDAQGRREYEALWASR